MQEAFGLQFKRKYIDAALAPWLPTISNPLIIGYQYEADEFVDTLTHELHHVLFTDNTTYSSRGGDAFDEKLDWKKLYGEGHTNTTLVHIPVHAGLKYIYLDILKEPYRLKRDIKFSLRYEDYKKAWEYVEQNDYMEIIKKLKQDYQTFAK
jgi:hypothetical protein